MPLIDPATVHPTWKETIGYRLAQLMRRLQSEGRVRLTEADDGTPFVTGEEFSRLMSEPESRAEIETILKDFSTDGTGAKHAGA